MQYKTSVATMFPRLHNVSRHLKKVYPLAGITAFQVSFPVRQRKTAHHRVVVNEAVTIAASLYREARLIEVCEVPGLELKAKVEGIASHRTRTDRQFGGGISGLPIGVVWPPVKAYLL
jgi:hypothetical protein